MRVYTIGNNIKLGETGFLDIYPKFRKKIPQEEVFNSIKDVPFCKVFEKFEQARTYAESISIEETSTYKGEKPAIFTMEIDDNIYNIVEAKSLTCWESESGRAKYLTPTSVMSFDSLEKQPAVMPAKARSAARWHPGTLKET